VTVERYVVVCHALSARVVCRRPRALAVIAALLLAFVALNLHFFWTVELRYVQVPIAMQTRDPESTDSGSRLRVFLITKSRDFGTENRPRIT